MLNILLNNLNTYIFAYSLPTRPQNIRCNDLFSYYDLSSTVSDVASVSYKQKYFEYEK